MPEPLVVVYGDDPHLVTTEALRLRDQLARELGSELSLEEFRRSRDLDAIAQSVATPPFLALRRVVVLWDPPQLEAGQRADREAERLATLLGERMETTAVVVVGRQPGAGTSALLRALKAAGAEVRRLQRPRGQELRQHVRRRLEERRLRVGRGVLERLLDVAARDMGQLEQELEKLELYTGGSAELADGVGLQLVTAAPPTEVYRITDALFETPRRLGERLALAPELPPPLVVGALARVLRDLIALADPEQAPSDLPGWRQEKLQNQLHRAGPARLRRWLVQLADLDWAARTGAIELSEGLAAVLAGMATELASAAA